MKMKLREVEPCLTTLVLLVNGRKTEKKEDQNKKVKEKRTFPPKLSYAFARNIEKLQAEHERINKERIKLCEQYARKDEEGKFIMKMVPLGEDKETEAYDIPDENLSAFSEEYNSFLDEEIEIELRKVTEEVIEQWGDNPRYEPPAVPEIMSLFFMIEK